MKTIASVFLLALVTCSKTEPPPPATPEVRVIQVVQKDVPVYIELIGATLGSEDIEIRPRVEGYLVAMNFTEGSFVGKGDLLYKIDPQPFEAALAEAKADLATSYARLDKTKNDVARLAPLAKERAVSQQELDNALSSNEAARTQVAAFEAKVTKAKLDLAYTTITSPTDGIIGTTKLKVGGLVGRGDASLLNTVSKVDPIFFRCAIAEAEYLKIARRSAGRSTPLMRQYGVELILADGSVHPYKGQLDTIERAVDPTTGTLTGQFSFPNPQRILRPNQYGRARFVVDVKEAALVIPQRALQEVQGVRSVMIVKPDATVEQRILKGGERVDDFWLVDSGIKPGESVITEGAQRAQPGSKVVARLEKPGEAPVQTAANASSPESNVNKAKGK